MAQKTLPEQLLSELRRFNEDPSVLEGYSTTRLKELYRTINKFNIEQQKTIAIRGTSLNTFRKNIVFELQVRGEVPTVDAKRKVVTKLEKTRRNAAKVAKNIHESNRKALIYGISGATDGLIGTETLDRVTKIQKNIVDSTIDSIFARPRNVPKAIKVGFDQILQGHIADKRLAFKNYAKKQGFRTPVRLGPSITPQQARPQIEKLDKIAKDYEKKTGLTLTRQDKYGSLASHAKKLGY